MATDRGRPRDQPRDEDNVVPLRGRSSISAAREYTPRGKTIREAGDARRAAPEADPERPRLRVVTDPEPPPAPRRATRTKPRAEPRPEPRAEPRKRQPRPPRARRPSHPGNPQRRLRFSAALLMLLFVVLGGRLVELQFGEARDAGAAGMRNRTAEMILPAQRGAILDRNGKVLAHSVEARLIFADPPRIADASEAAKLLSPLLGIARSDLWQMLQVTKNAAGVENRYLPLKRGVDIPTATAVMALGLHGINWERDSRREVPGNDLAANLIGFAGQEKGLVGLESAYDYVLAGRAGSRSVETGTLDRPIPNGFHSEQAAVPGGDVRLTIDWDLQFKTQQVLTELMSKANAQFSCAIVLDTHTGELLAMASTPTYNAASPPEKQPPDTCSGVIVDPGSIHKAITIGAALQENKITPDSLITTESQVVRGGQEYKDSTGHPTQNMTIPGILAQSSNVGTIHIAEQLGSEKLYEYQKLFGLGASTKCGVPGESAGLLRPPAEWSGSSWGSIPIGLGVSVTPLQMAAAYATIANDGVYNLPKLVAGTTVNGKAKPTPKSPSHRVLDVEKARVLRTMMEAVTSPDVPGATGTKAQIAGYRVAGKTGTGSFDNAKKVDVTSFIGMVPAEAPQYVVAVFQYSPGGDAARSSEVFKDVMSFTLSKYAVPPTTTKPPEFHVTG